MGSKAESATTAAEERADLLRRFLVPPSAPGTPEERAARAREAMSGLQAGVRITKAMYRPGR